MAIEFQHISKRFGDTRALEDVSLTFEEGKIYGLLGNNGAGKSTLLNILTGRLCPDSGTVTVDDAPAGSDAALSRLFLVGEKNLYPDDMKVKRALDTAELFYPDFDRAYAEELAKQFELPCFIRFRTAHPIIGSGTNDGKSLLAKPFQILHHRIILPGCHSHIPCNMIFERTIDVGYRIILVSLITTFPWIHCSFVTVHKSIMLGCVQTLITILYH